MSSSTYLTCFSFISAYEHWRTQVSSRKLVHVLRTSDSALHDVTDFNSSSSCQLSRNSDLCRGSDVFETLNLLPPSNRKHREEKPNLCFQVNNNLIVSFIKLILLFSGIAKAGISRSQRNINLHHMCYSIKVLQSIRMNRSMKLRSKYINIINYKIYIYIYKTKEQRNLFQLRLKVISFFFKLCNLRC